MYIQDYVSVAVKLKARLSKPSIILPMENYTTGPHHLNLLYHNYEKASTSIAPCRSVRGHETNISEVTDPNKCCMFFVSYEDDIIEGARVDGFPVNVVQDCVEDTVKDSAGDECFYSFILTNIPFKLVTKFDNYSYKFVHHVHCNRYCVYRIKPIFSTQTINSWLYCVIYVSLWQSFNEYYN